MIISELPNAIAAEMAVPAMMAQNAYRKGAFQFNLQPFGWKRVQLLNTAQDAPYFASELTGLAFDVFEHEDGRIAVSFRGTDDFTDWGIANAALGISVPYKVAFKHFKQLHEVVYPGKIAFVTGHSLGGGLALGVSVRFGVPAYAFNTSPRIFDGLGDQHQVAVRKVVYKTGDPLRWTWTLIWKVKAAIKSGASGSAIYKASFDYAPHRPSDISRLGALADNHYMFKLVRGIITRGKYDDQRLQQLEQELINSDMEPIH